MVAMIFTACGATGEADPAPATTPKKPSAPVSAEPAAGEVRLGVPDKGIWPDLDDKVQIKLPAGLTPDRVSARIDGGLLVVLVDGFPRKAYPLTGTAKLVVGKHALALRPGDKAELEKLLTADKITTAAKVRDRDGDGITDPLDVFIGAKKTALNADAYTEGYVTIKYPMGDVPREMGVCTDVVIRAVRNAGIDLQQALHEDIKRAKKAYPMVKGRGNANIDHRRVKTILPYFVRHWEKHTITLDDKSDPLRPGDIVFMDTFPSKAGPDHIGIVSDTIGESGHPMIINNWTNGTVTTEMDLLAFVPLTHRFRLPE